MVDNTTFFITFYFYGKNISSIEEIQTFINLKVVELPDNIGNLTKLETLYVYNNSFTELPASFLQLTDLQFLQLGFNNLIDLPKEQYDFIAAVPTNYGYYQYYEEETNLTGYPKNNFSFSGFPIYSQIKIFGIDGSYAYYLIYPDDSIIEITPIIGENGLVTIPGDLLTMSGEYWFA